MRLAWVITVATVLCCSTTGHAEVTFGDEAPRVFSIQKRPYRLTHEFELGVGVLPLDAFYVGAVVGFSYTYHFSDFWAWEILSADYSINFDTGLKNHLRSEYDLEPDRLPPRIQLFGATSLIVKPLFGKLAWVNDSIVLGETFFVAGIGPHLRVAEATSTRGAFSEWVPAVNLGLGLRLWSGEVLSWRLMLRDYLMFVRAIPENSLLLMVSASFNYALDDDEAEKSKGEQP